MLLKEKALRLCQSQAAQYGRAFSHEATKRRKIGERYGRTPGEKSVGRVERQLQREGRMGRRRFYPGEAIPARFGIPMRDAGRGIVVTWPISRQERRAIARAKKKAAAQRPPTIIGDGSGPNRADRRRRERPAAPAPATPTRARSARPVEAWELEASRAMLEAIKKKPEGN